MSDYALTAIGRDRPGIVAAISAALLDLEGNIEDSRMAILGGHFSVMLIVKVPQSVSAETLSERLDQVADEMSLEAVSVSPVGESTGESLEPSHVLTVYGADHPGIVAAVSGALADLGVNITDLSTRLAGSDDAPLYAMILELGLGDIAPEDIEAALATVGSASKLEVSLRELATEAF